MFILNLLATKVFEIGLTIVDEIAGTIEQGFRTTVFGANTYQGEDESAIALVLRNNSNAMQLFAESQMSLVEVQHRQNELKQIELMLTAELAQQERELKAHLSELWRDLKRELQQNELSNRQNLQNKQIQADWDKIKLPTVFSRQELESLAQDTGRPLFVCAKMQITEGCPDYFRTELVADTESQIKKFANLVFQGNVRFYSRFFDDENIFDTNAAQLRSIIPNVPSVMSFSKVTRRKAYLHYQLWGSRSAEILNGSFDVELPWREVAQQLRDESKDASISDDDLCEIIGDWLTTLQKIYAVFLMDLYAIVDGDDPFCAMKLDSVNVGLPEDLASQYIQPLTEILQRIQKERIEAFNEALRRQQDEKERNRQEEDEVRNRQLGLRKQREEKVRQEAERKAQEKSQKQREQAQREAAEQKILAEFLSVKGMQSEYQKLDLLLAAKKWYEADALTREIMLYVANLNSQEFLSEISIQNFASQDLRTIDQLWVSQSNGKFGFSEQKKLWLECGGKISQQNKVVWEKFGAKVGWYHNSEWRSYDDFAKIVRDKPNDLPQSSLPRIPTSLFLFRRGIAYISLFSLKEL